MTRQYTHHQGYHRKTHCIHGHLLENPVVQYRKRPDGQGFYKLRRCRTCMYYATAHYQGRHRFIRVLPKGLLYD